MRHLKTLISSLLTMVFLVSNINQSLAVEVPEFKVLTPHLCQLFLDKAQERVDDYFARGGEEPYSLQHALECVFSGTQLEIPGKEEGNELTKLTTEDINCLGKLSYRWITFRNCDLTDVESFDGLFERGYLIDVGVKNCKVSPGQFHREGWDWWEYTHTFHDMKVRFEDYR